MILIHLQVTHQTQEHIEEREVGEKREGEERVLVVIVVLEEVLVLLVQVLSQNHLIEGKAVQRVIAEEIPQGKKIIIITLEIVIT